MTVSKGSIKDVRDLNRGIILDLVRTKGPCSRADLARSTGLTRSAVSNIVSDLVADAQLREIGIGNNWTGRKPVLYEYNARSACVLGLDIGGTGLHCAAADLSGEILVSARWALPKGVTRDALLHLVFGKVDGLCREARLEPGKLKAIGIATTGVVDHVTGRILGSAPNLPDWAGVPLGQFVSTRYQVPVVVDNDVHCSLQGEVRKGAAQGRQNVAFINVGTGLGAALMLGGRLYRGTRHGSGEIGYWVMGREHLGRDWAPKGCLESLAAGPGIVRRALDLSESHPGWALAGSGSAMTAESVCQAARAGDPLACSVVEETAEYLGVAVVNLANLLDLEMVVFGGGVMRSADLLLPTIQAIVERHVVTPPQIVLSEVADASTIGAIDLALETVHRTVTG